MPRKPGNRDPNLLGWMVDEDYRLRVVVEELVDRANLAKKALADHRKKALERFGKQGLKGATGNIAVASISERKHYKVGDRRALDEWVSKHGHPELYSNRVSGEAYKELLEAGLEPEGIEVYTEVQFTTKKRK